MNLVFGTYLDGARPPVPPETTAEFGARRVGVQGLVEELEVRLGLSGVFPEESERRLAYVEALERHVRAASVAAPFFADALAANPVAVASDLLRRRDELIVAGCDLSHREALSGAPGRILDFADVERTAGTGSPVRAGLADRMAAICAALGEGNRPVTLESVATLEPRELLATGVARLLSHVASSGIRVTDKPLSAEAPEETNLGRVQRLLSGALDRTRGGSGGPADPDGTLVVAQTHTTRAGLELLARFLRAGPARRPTLVVPEAAWFLGEALSRDGVPHPGATDRTAPAAATSIMGLSCLLWKPLDPERLVRLLRSQAAPLPSPLALRLAAALESEPGVGGHAWMEALEKGLSGIEEPERKSRARSLYRTFFADGPFGPRSRAPRGSRVPALHVAEFYRECASVFQARDERLAALASSISAAASASFRGAVGEAALQNLAEAVLGSCRGPSRAAEAAGEHAAVHPGAIEASDDLIWIPAVRTTTLPADFWLAAERDWLSGAGFTLAPASADAERDYHASVRALCSCGSRYVLVVPALSGGEAAEPHAMVAAAEALLKRVCGRAVGRLPLESVLDPDRLLIPEPAVGLPRRTAAWRLPEGVITMRSGNESPSSLKKLCEYPYQYVLNYAARIHRNTPLRLSSGPLLCGNIVHGAVEQFFADAPWDPARPPAAADIDHWMDDRFPGLMDSIALPVLQPGREGEYTHVKSVTGRALKIIVDQVRHRGASEVEIETDRSGTAGSLSVAGRIDILAKGGPRPAVIDIKWGGRVGRELEVGENRDVQLSLYGVLVDEVGAPDVDIGYLIVTAGLLITHPDSGFLNPMVPDGSLPVVQSVPALVSALKTTVDWRAGQLFEGTVELCPPHVNELAEPPPGTLPRQVDRDRYDEFATLLGWEADHA